MRVLVSGSTGQLGSAVVSGLLDQGVEVHCLVQNPENLGLLPVGDRQIFEGDLLRPETLQEPLVGVEAVIHCAGRGSYDRADRAAMEAVNVDGTRHLLDAACKAGVRRFVHSSSIATLGYVEHQGEGDETNAYNWGGLGVDYFDTQKTAEDLVMSEGGLEVLALNPGIVLGRGDKGAGGGRILLDLYRGRVPGIPSGATTLANLEDVASGHIAALEKGRAGERYVLGGAPLTWEEVFLLAASIVDCDPPKMLKPRMLQWIARGESLRSKMSSREPRLRPSLVTVLNRNRRYSSDKAEEELGYRPAPITAGMVACWQWFKSEGLVS
jgi:dihydroflavonol-4-reductase